VQAAGGFVAQNAAGAAKAVAALKVPALSLPPISLPVTNLPALRLPALKLPAAALPSVSLPTISLPKVLRVPEFVITFMTKDGTLRTLRFSPLKRLIQSLPALRGA